MYKTLALALAAAAAAVPTPQSSASLGTPPKESEFGLAMKVEGSYVSLNAANNQTSGSYVLQAERLSVYPGTPAYFNGTGRVAGMGRALNFDINGVAWGLFAPDVGHVDGHVASVTAQDGSQQEEWYANEKGVIRHKLTATTNGFFACKDHSLGVPENYYLKWGNAQYNGQPPAGCVSTEVIQNFNIESGAKNPNA